MDPFSELIKSPGVVHSSLESLGMMSSESLASVAAVDRVGNAEASIVASAVRIRHGATERGSAHEDDDDAATSPMATLPKRRRIMLGVVKKVFMPSRLRKVTLSLMSEEELVRGSVVHVFNPDKPYSSGSDHLPVSNAINDTRMGVIEHGLVCATCGGDAKTCPGHFGHMMLNIAIFHPSYMKLALRVLRCVCWTCASLLNPGLVTPDEAILETMFSPKEIRKLAWISKRRPPHNCPVCSMPQPIYSKATSTRIAWAWNAKRIAATPVPLPPDVVYEMQTPFTAARARMIFDAIDEPDLIFMGLNPKTAHPKNFIMRALPVPPPCVRPSVVKIEGSKMRGQDDLTGILMNICKRIAQARNSFFDERNSPKKMYEFGIVLDECETADLKRVSKNVSKAGKKEEQRINKERKLEESKAKRAVGNYSRIPDNRTLTASAFPLKVMPHIISKLSMPFDEGRIDSLIAMTRPHTSPATARLSSRPDLRHCEYLQSKNSKILTIMELVLSMHLNTDGKDTSLMRQRSGAQKKTIIKRLKAKEGRMRGNIMGKRVFGSGRAVISPCQSLDVDELGIPQSMAAVLTYGKVLVNNNTIEKLRKCVRIGALRVNGANMVIKAADNTRIYLEYAIDLDRIAAELVSGDMVERYIQDGDLVIFNRQPSLHRVSMMAHRARIMDSSTLRFNSAAAKPYNADFDGDEMNIHIPKGIHAQAEAKELLSITNNMISPATNAMTLGIVQDGIVAAYLFTDAKTRLTRAQLHRLLCVVKYLPPERLENLPEPHEIDQESGQPLWTGRQALSILLPPWLEIRLDDSQLAIHKGVINPDPNFPPLTKKLMGSNSNGITHRICVDGSLQAGMHFMSDAQRMLHAWMAEAGFTTGLHDLILENRVRTRIRYIMNSILDVVDACNSVMFELTQNSTRFVKHEVEQKARALIANVVEEATQIGIRYLRNDHDSGGKLTRNGLWDMIVSGSKGSTANAFQMVIAVGTQIISGQRIPIDETTKRTLTCFAPGRNDAASRGLVRHSYVDGLRPYEFFMHNMGGREGIVHTAIKTAETGYLQRRLIKAMEDLVGMADGSVRDGELRVVQYLYGGDGMDPTRVQLTAAPFINLSKEQLRGKSSRPEFAELFMDLRARLRGKYSGLEDDATLLIPGDPQRVLDNAMHTPPFSKYYERHFVVGETESPLRAIADYFAPRHLPFALFVLWTLRDEDREAIVKVCCVAAAMYDRSRMAAGETCGIISAQSIGEPSTQMTLNSPHHSGRVGSRVTMGVPRLREIIDRRKAGTMDTPLMIIPVVANTQEMAEKVMRMVRRIRLRDVLNSSFVALDPVLPKPHPPSNMPKDNEWMVDLEEIGKRESDAVREWKSTAVAAQYVIRFSLRRDVMLEMGIAPYTMAKAIEKVVSSVKNSMAIILHSPRTAENWVVRVRLLHGEEMTDSEWYHETQQMHVQILRKACANQAHIVDWATAGKAEYKELDPESDCIQKKEVWVIQASGSSLASMSRIKELDWTRAHTNDIAMTNAVLGLEAANALYYEQMLSVLTNDGSYIDPRHVQLFADAVTYYGYPMPARRHGVLRKKTGWAHRASFEEMVGVLMAGAVRGEVEDLVAPAGAVMTGQMGAFGSGWVGLFDQGKDREVIKQLEMRMLAKEVDADIRNESSDVAIADRNILRRVNAATGTLMTRPVDVLRKIHEKMKIVRAKEKQDRQRATTKTPPPTPISIKPALHKYTVGGAIAASTYDGYADVNYDRDSRATFVVEQGRKTVGKKASAVDTVIRTTQPTSNLSLAGLEVTVLGKMGHLKVIHGL
jgi:DNA-directed RNA polymerase beta' subunit